MAGFAIVAILAACSDGAGPTGAAARYFDVQFDAASDTLGGRGLGVTVAVRDTADRLHAVTVTVTDDASVVVDRVTPPSSYSGDQFRTWASVVYVPGPGRYTVAVTAIDATGRTETVTSARTVRIDDEAYAVTMLPDRGADAGVRWVDARGTVAGWVGTAAGGRRPAIWRGGVLTEVLATDSVDVEAVAVDTAGDVLLQLAPSRTAAIVDDARRARVRTADGREVVLGPLTYPTRAGDVVPGGLIPTCCSLAADLSERRVAVGAAAALYTANPSSVVLDLAAGRADSMPGLYRFWNARGQAVRVTYSFGLYPTTDVAGVNLAVPPFPAEGGTRDQCDPIAGRYHTTVPLDLDDDGRLLVDSCGTPALLVPNGASRWLDRAVGAPRRAIRLSRQGGIVAALDTAGALWLWRAATARTTRVRLPAPGWRLDALGTVNGAGLIAAHGVEAGTGRRAALLLAPAAQVR